MARESGPVSRKSFQNADMTSRTEARLTRELPKGAAPSRRTETSLNAVETVELRALEYTITEAKRGLKEIKEAFEAKVNDPDSPRRDQATIEDWAINYGPYRDTFRQAVGNVFGTQDAYMRKDARDYYHLTHRVRELERELAKYKRAKNIAF